jgi:HEAT repeat protein
VDEARAVPILLGLLQLQDLPDQEFETVTVVLGEIGTPQTITTLRNIVRHSDRPNARFSTLHTLIERDQVDFDFLSSVLNDVANETGDWQMQAVWRIALEALAEMQDPRIVPLLERLLAVVGTSDPRDDLISALGSSQQRTAVPILARLLQETALASDEYFEIIDALGATRQARAVSILTRLLQTSPSSDTLDVILEALAITGRREVVAVFVNWMQESRLRGVFNDPELSPDNIADEIRNTQCNIIGFLEEMGQTGNLEAVRALLSIVNAPESQFSSEIRDGAHDALEFIIRDTHDPGIEHMQMLLSLLQDPALPPDLQREASNYASGEFDVGDIQSLELITAYIRANIPLAVRMSAVGALISLDTTDPAVLAVFESLIWDANLPEALRLEIISLMQDLDPEEGVLSILRNAMNDRERRLPQSLRDAARAAVLDLESQRTHGHTLDAILVSYTTLP